MLSLNHQAARVAGSGSRTVPTKPPTPSVFVAQALIVRALRHAGLHQVMYREACTVGVAGVRPGSYDAVSAAMRRIMSQHPSLADTAHDALVAPWVEANLALMRRAVDRGEIPADADIAAVAQVTPSMGAYRSLVQRLPFDREFLVSMVDGLVLPALGIKRRP